MLGTRETARRPHLLLVDDCVPQRDLYELVLQSEFEVITATRGAEGVALATKECPDVVVLDVMMPGVDGWEVCTQLKSHWRTAHVPVILLTGADDGDLSQHAMAVGATAVLKKPCPANVLRQAISTALEEPDSASSKR
jgi:putative two-component system response regulator